MAPTTAARGVTSVELERHVDADAASVALLLAGPSGTAAVQVRSADATLVVGPPLRTSLGFSATISVMAGDETVCRGRLRITPGLSGSTLAVSMPTDRADVDDVRREVARFLRALAGRAQARASVA
jgi:hypothetical protein